ncbi:putative mediator of RNA polymerase II transcription subunit 26b [Canna indica]|uniref:Mediator of RNA polymerase II transcription subunit 26b n=1 Tax=Canna indica TaxID=4628 RepID=A0AAQ3K4I4_9LILI|nr:putative mediator of RNA polymerase II transcription subunit 26b [Canna indica]
MASSSGSLDYWRKFFRSANSDIFEIIEQAVVVAASDHPQEFRSRRDQMMEKFYTLLLPRCFGCDRVDIRGAAAADGSVKREAERETEKESKVDSSSDAPEELNLAASNCSYNETEALTEEIQEETQIAREVFRIKAILERVPVESDSVLFESLSHLQSFQLSVQVLKETEIGKTVNILRKHSSKQIRRLVRTLIESWKDVVDQWVTATSSITDNSPYSLNPSMLDDESLPSASLEDGDQTTSIKFAKSFNGMDDDDDADDENIRNNQHDPMRKQHPPPQCLVPDEGEIRRQELRQPADERGQMRKQEQWPALPAEKRNFRREELVMRTSKPPLEPCIMQEKPQFIVNKQSKPVVPESGPGRPPKFPTVRKADNEMNSRKQQQVAFPRKPPMVPQDKSKNLEEDSVRARLEVAKRKLHEGYQQAENAKRQRTIQVMELQEIPKQVHNNVQSATKFRNLNKNSPYGRQLFS